MKVKLFTILDICTEIKAMGIEMISDDLVESEILQYVGYGDEPRCINLCQLSRGGCTYDPYDWKDGSRTMQVAHEYIQDNWSKLETGDIIDVRKILGEPINE